MTPAGRSLLGIGLLVAGGLMTLVAGLLVWSSIQRWCAANEVRAATQSMRNGRFTEARGLAARAAARLPTEPAPLLLATDLTQEGADARLMAVVPGLTDLTDRRTVLAAVALSRVLHGRSTDSELDGTGDGRLIAALIAARAGRTAEKLAVEGDDPPHLAVQRAALTALLRGAWARGDAEMVRRSGGALLLLAPRHPEAAIIASAILAATPAVADEVVVARAGEVAAERCEAVVRALATLAPARRAALAKRFPKILAEVKP